MHYLEVILPLPLPGVFTYSIVDDMHHDHLTGSRVIVPFGKRKIYTGVVLKERSSAPGFSGIKAIMEILDETPILNRKQLQLIQWIADYYMAAIGDVYNAALPANLKLTSESYLSLLASSPIATEHLSDHEFNLVQLLEQNELSTDEVRQVTGLKNPYRVIKSLRDKGLIHLYEKVKDKYVPKTETRIRLTPEYLREEALEALTQMLEKKPKQLDVLLFYLKAVDIFEDPGLNQTGVSRKHLTKNGISPSSLKTLVKNGVLEEWEQVVDRFAFDKSAEVAIPELSPAQMVAKNEILNHFENKETVLLKGITGSGKTEIYIDLIRSRIDAGEQVLYMLPEIALTTQIIKRLRRVFGEQFGIYHSRFSDNERAEIYQGCLEGKFDFVVGVRSAVFLPFQNLSLIIVDEEHEASYKQYDPAPRYHARDTALYMARLHNAKVLLGSATPSLESFHNARMGKFGMVSLDERYDHQPLPEISVVDLKKARKQRQIKGNTTGELLEAINRSLAGGKQVILFQNRRGYSPFLQCENCGHIPKCLNCSVSLTYHIYQNQLICHYCGFRQYHESACSSCNTDRVKTVGAGTEMIEEELGLLLPDVKMKRMDLDTTRSKNAYQQIIDDFEDGDISVLIGTQMITKGLDFEHVNLVGVYDADRMIHFPDFRSHERAFQMIMQVSGRAGRKHEKGTVLIQSSDPAQPVLTHIVQGKQEEFYQMELNEREQYRFPPFYRLVRIIIRDRDKQKSFQGANQFHTLLQKDLKGRLSPVTEPVIGKIRNFYIHEIVLRLEKTGLNISAVKEYLQASRDTLLALPAFKSLLVHFDVDPL